MYNTYTYIRKYIIFYFIYLRNVRTSNRQQVSIICLYDKDKTGVARGGVCSLAQKTVLSSRDPQQILTVCISVYV